MSTPAPAETPLLQATKKQLDELDSLIQRMLALPVVEVPEDVSTPPEPPQPEAEPLPMLELPYEESLPDSPQEGQPLNELPADQLPPPPASDGLPVLVSEPVGAAFPPDAETDEDSPPRSRLIWPLVPPNWLFDVATTPLGPAGNWLRGEHGRMLLGFTGLALLLAAAVVGVLDWVLGNW